MHTCVRWDRLPEGLFPITQADFDAVQAAGREFSPQAAVTWGLHVIHASEQPAVA
jgi:hypothetical protein